MRISDWSSDVCSSDLEHVSNWPLLSLVIWLPIIGGGLVLALGNQRANAARWLSLLIAFAVFVLSIPLFTGFDYANAGLQFIERREWIPAYALQYHLGADGIQIHLILLPTITHRKTAVKGMCVSVHVE